MKAKWEGVFNWKGEVHHIYITSEGSEDTIRLKMIAKLAQKLHRAPYILRQEFSGMKPNFELRKLPCQEKKL